MNDNYTFHYAFEGWKVPNMDGGLYNVEILSHYQSQSRNDFNY